MAAANYARRGGNDGTTSGGSRHVMPAISKSLYDSVMKDNDWYGKKKMTKTTRNYLYPDEMVREAKRLAQYERLPIGKVMTRLAELFPKIPSQPQVYQWITDGSRRDVKVHGDTSPT